MFYTRDLHEIFRLAWYPSESHTALSHTDIILGKYLAHSVEYVVYIWRLNPLIIYSGPNVLIFSSFL